MKQQALKKQRDYNMNPRMANEPPDLDYRNDMNFEGEVTRTKQSEAEACDINNIMKRYEATGWLPENDRVPQYGDFSTVETFHEAMGIVSRANETFAALPAEIRARFRNDPAELLGLVEKASKDKKAADELVDLGLAIKIEEPQKTQEAPASAASKP